MSKGLLLHPKRGVNPRLTACPRCGKDANEILLIGARDYINKCCECGTYLIGGGPCPKHPGRRTERVRMIGEYERLPASQPCDDCRKELKEHRAIVEAGGIYFRCKRCKSEGVVKAGTDMANAVREQLDVAAPKPCGVELDQCPACEPDGAVS